LLEYPNISYEDVLIKNPECIFYLCDTNNKGSLEDLKSGILKSLSVTDACKNGKVFPVDENIFSRPGPRVTDCIKMLRLKVF
jgi:ABC-type Fe3+-hydroxamate transport system substrate-binding protein